MSEEIKLYKCRGYLFCMYRLLNIPVGQIAKENNTGNGTIYNWLIIFDMTKRQLTKEHKRKISKNGKKLKHTKKTKERLSGKNSVHWKENNDHYNTIHYKAHKVQPKPTDDKCQLCNQVADEKGITKLVHSNKNHTYNLPINPNEWWWLHRSCHNKYDWTPEKRKEQSEKTKKLWTPERRKKQSERIKEILKQLAQDRWRYLKMSEEICSIHKKPVIYTYDNESYCKDCLDAKFKAIITKTMIDKKEKVKK